MTNATFRPLGQWPRPDTQRRRGRHTFRASWADTLELLDRELEHLGAENVITSKPTSPNPTSASTAGHDPTPKPPDTPASSSHSNPDTVPSNT